MGLVIHQANCLTDANAEMCRNRFFIQVLDFASQAFETGFPFERLNFSSGCGFLKTGSSAADSSYAFILNSHSEEKRFNRKTYTTTHVAKPNAMNASNRASSKSHGMMRSLAF